MTDFKNTCGHQCFIIGGPFISEDPECPVHGAEGRREREAKEQETESLRTALREAVMCVVDDLRPDAKKLAEWQQLVR